MGDLSNLRGKWELVYADNVAEYCDAIGTAEDKKEAALKLLVPGNDIVQEIDIQGETVTIVTHMPGGIKNEIKAKLGEDVKASFVDGRQLACQFSRAGDSLVEQQSGDFNSTNKRYIQDGQLIMVR